MANDALERLFNSNNQEQSDYSLEEQMDSASDDDFLEGMSNASKTALLKSVTEVTLDEESSNDDVIVSIPEESTNEPEKIVKHSKGSNEELFNNNTEEKKTRKRRKTIETTEIKSTNNIDSNISFNPIMNQLAKDVIDDLRKKNYKISRFDDSTMELVFTYMYNKF